jgi:hypothetical protein
MELVSHFPFKNSKIKFNVCFSIKTFLPSLVKAKLEMIIEAFSFIPSILERALDLASFRDNVSGSALCGNAVPATPLKMVRGSF